MAEELDDGEFWLPSQFLTDDDILSDFGSGSVSGFGSFTSDDDVSDCAIHSKLTAALSSSPQSTLFGCECNNQQVSSSSSGSPKEPEKKQEDDNNNCQRNETLDLLNKAAGEVAKMKIRSENKSVGTGFFDCSNSVKGRFCPPPPQQQPHQRNSNIPVFQTTSFYPSHPQFHFFPPHMMYGPPQNKATKDNTKNNNKNSSNRPLGLPQSAWPPLPGQTQAQAQAQPQSKPVMGMSVGPQRDSVGTGVFLPRRIVTPASGSKKKSDGNVTKTKNNKGLQRRESLSTKVKEDEFQLPSEWVY